jgi:hypothetical protein
MSINSIAAEFLDNIASTQGYERSGLSIRAELRTGGPTIQPGAAKPEQIETVTESIGNGTSGPHGSYDSLGSKHIQYDVIMQVTEGDISIPRTLYSWQHHPMPGCCKFAVNRWVRSNDAWPNDLQRAALVMRRQIAKTFGYGTLYVSSGPSGRSSGELYDEFQEIYNDNVRSMFAIPTT